jgi:hypothetical protein
MTRRQTTKTTGRAFAFATDRSLRPWSRAFLVHPEASMVLLTPDQFTISFGRWSLSTSPANIADVTVTGPYQWWKVAGPPRLSLSDRGITFASTNRRGVCVSFHRPVRAIDPFGLVRHRAATVTVADPDAFAAAVRAVIAGEAADEVADEEPASEAAGPRQGTFRASVVAVLRWQRRAGSVRHERRDVEHIEPPYPPVGSDEVVQSFDDGVGPAFHRRYSVVIDGADADAVTTMARVQSDFNQISSQELAPITKVSGVLGTMRPGDRYVVALAGPWSGPVGVAATEPDCFRLVTLEGHLEAGTIEFRATDLPDGGLQFSVESWARSGDQGLRVLYDRFGIAQVLQSEMWVELCEAVVALVHGSQRGPVDVLTERAAA